MKSVTLKSEHQPVGRYETRKPPLHAVYEEDVLILQTEDFAVALQCYVNRMMDLSGDWR